MADPVPGGIRCGCTAVTPLCACQQNCWDQSSGDSLDDYLDRLDCLNVCEDKGPYIRQCWLENGPTPARWEAITECRGNCGTAFVNSGDAGGLAVCLGGCQDYDQTEFNCNLEYNEDLNNEIANCLDPISETFTDCWQEAFDARDECEGEDPDYDNPDPVERAQSIAEWAANKAECCTEFWPALGECEDAYYNDIPACTGNRCLSECTGAFQKDGNDCQTCYADKQSACDLACEATSLACQAPCHDAQDSCVEDCFINFPFPGPGRAACISDCSDAHSACTGSCVDIQTECEAECQELFDEAEAEFFACHRESEIDKLICDSDCCDNEYASDIAQCTVTRYDDEDFCKSEYTGGAQAQCLAEANADERYCKTRRWNDIIKDQDAWNFDVYDCAIDCDATFSAVRRACLPWPAGLCPSGPAGESCRQCERDAVADMMQCKVQCCMDKEPANPPNPYVPCYASCQSAYLRTAPTDPSRETTKTACINACKADDPYGQCCVCSYFIGTPGHMPSDPQVENDNLAFNFSYYFRRCVGAPPPETASDEEEEE